MSRPPDPLAALEQAQRRLLESLWGDDFSTGSDSWLRLRDRTADPNHWVPISQPSDRRHGQNWPLWRTEQELDDLRQRSRVTAGSNGYAMCLIQNLQNYVVGDGCKYKVKLREGLDADPDTPGVQEPGLVGQAQAELDRLMALNRWNGQGDPKRGRVVTESREREILRRVVRDGECFLRYYEDGDDLHTRFLEPEQVRQAPAGATQADGWSFGTRHQVEPYEDVETAEAYHILWQDPTAAPGRKPPEGEVVDAAEVLHLKAPGTDATLARGTPLFVFDVGDALERASKLQRYLSISSAIRAATAEVWKNQATMEQVRSLSDAVKTGTRTDPDSGKVENVERIAPGTIRRVSPGQEPVPLPATTGVPEFLQAAQGDLRLASAGVCAPEYMTGDASNANYASTQEAGAPWVQQARSLQSYYQFAFLCVAWRFVRHAVACGRLPGSALTDLEIQVEAPAVLHKDPLQTAQADKLLVDMGAKDVQTVAMEHGLDPETVAANREEWQARFPPQPPPGPGGQGGEGPDGGDRGVPPRPFAEGAGPGPAPSAGGPRERAGLIADILAGLYGDDAEKLFDAAHGGGLREGLLREAWDSIQHPRDRKTGRFITAGSTAANQAAHARVKGVLAGDRTPEGLKTLVEHLSILTVQQLHELKRAHGLKASGKNKAELARKIAERLPHAGKGEEPAAPAAATTPAPAERPGWSAPAADLTAVSPENPLFRALHQVEDQFATGAMASVKELRAAMPGVGKEELDAALLELGRRGVLALHRDNFPGQSAARGELPLRVYGGKDAFGDDVHFMGVGLRDTPEGREAAKALTTPAAPAERPGWSAPTTDRFGREVRKHAGGWQVESTPSGVHAVVNGETREERGSFRDLAQAQASAESAGRFGTGPTTAEDTVSALQARPPAPGAPPASLEADLRAANTADPRTGLGPTIPDLYDRLRAAHPGLTEPAFHDFLRGLRDQGKATLQTWETSVPLGRSGHPAERFPRLGARGAPAGWVHLAPAPQPGPAPAPGAPPAAAPFDPAAHVGALVDAVRKHGRGANLADLVPVRRELGHLTREQQDAVIHHARQQRQVFGTRYEGRHGLTPEQRAAQHQPPGTEDREGSGYGDAVGMLSVREDALSGVGSAGKSPPAAPAGLPRQPRDALEAVNRVAQERHGHSDLIPAAEVYDALGVDPARGREALLDLWRQGKVHLHGFEADAPPGRAAVEVKPAHRRTFPTVATPAQVEAVKARLGEAIARLAPEHPADGGALVPVWRLRREVPAPDRAAFDRAANELRAEGRLRMVPLADQAQATAAQLDAGVRGVGETHFYLQPVK